MTQKPVALVWRYASAVLALALATLLRLLLAPVLLDYAPFLTFFAATMFVAWYAGLGPALLTLIGGALIASYLFVPPRDVLWPAEVSHWVALVLHGITGLVVIGLTELLRRGKARVEAIEARFRHMLETSHIGVFIADQHGRVAYANPAMNRISGYTEAEVAAGQVRWDRLTPPEYAHVTARALEELQAHGVCTPFELEFFTKDERRVPILVGASVLERAADGTLMIAACVTDLTALKQVLAALKESEARYRIVAEYNYDWEYWLAPDGVLRYVSPSCETVSGYRPEAFIADPALLGRIVHPDDAAAFERHQHSIQEARDDTASLDFRIIRPDGAVRWVNHVCRPVFGADGEYLGRRASNRDITERKSTEAERERLLQQLAEADRRKDEFLAVLAHELRNPLAPIANAVEVLKRQASPHDPTVQWAGELIGRQVGQLTHLVNDLLDVARITRGRIELKKERVDLGDIIARAVDTTRPLIEARRHRLTVSLPPEPLVLEADPDRLVQVFGNLLDNAAKYTPAGGRIEVTAAREAEAVMVRVRDTGAGIAPGLLPHLFEPFMQANHSLARAGGGLGLGLPLAKRLVEMHGGSIRAESAGLGSGSVFSVRLPLATAQPITAPAPMGHTPATIHPLRLLVVEDNPDVAESFALLLRALGHEVCTAPTGMAALEEAPRFAPDVAFIDIGLPDLDGYEVARRLREAHGGRMRLVAVTGYGQEQDRYRAHEAGFEQHLLKPVNLDTLERLLASYAHETNDKGADPRLPVRE